MRNRSLLCGLLLAFAGAAHLFASPSPATHSPETLLSADEQLLAIGRQLPGFGGLFVDGSGRVNVYLVDPQAHGALARKALGAPSRVLRADFRFDELLGWRYALRPLLGLDGVTLLDVDEARNRVLLGVEPRLSAGERAELVARAAARGIPAAALLVEDRPAFAPLPADATGASTPKAFPSVATLDGKFRPAPGGVQIMFGGGLVCTLGFNAYLGKVFGFVVNGHCSAVRGETDGTLYSQGWLGDGTIGSETRDPGFIVEGDCPAQRRCRFSDSAFARYSKKSLGKLAQIARPTSGGAELGSRVLSPSSSRFTIVGKVPDPLVGQTAHKVGRTTGWTFGEVVGTCVDGNTGSDVTMLCQTLVAGGGGPGDSGSPVFSRVGTKQAKLMGILWGGTNVPDVGAIFVFSPLSAIERELGTLKVN